MRIKTIVGLACAGVAAAAVTAVGSAAYAEGRGEGTSTVPVVTTDQPARAVTQDDATRESSAPWDCPEKDGSGPGGSGSPAAPGQANSAPETL